MYVGSLRNWLSFNFTGLDSVKDVLQKKAKEGSL